MTKRELEREKALLEEKVKELTVKLNTTTNAFNRINDSLGEVEYNYYSDYEEYKEKYEEVKKVNQYLERLIYFLEKNYYED